MCLYDAGKGIEFVSNKFPFHQKNLQNLFPYKKLMRDLDYDDGCSCQCTSVVLAYSVSSV